MPFSAWGNCSPCAQACPFPYAFLCLILPCGAGCSVGMPGTALPLRRSPRLTVVSFSDLPGAWASAARPSWYGWPATEPADGKNGGFGGRELLNPRILESGHNMQVVIVASCQGTDSMRGFLYPVPALLLQEKQTTLSGAASASAKKIGKIRRPSRKGDTADPGTRRVVPADAAFCPLLFEAF